MWIANRGVNKLIAGFDILKKNNSLTGSVCRVRPLRVCTALETSGVLDGVDWLSAKLLLMMIDAASAAVQKLELRNELTWAEQDGCRFDCGAKPCLVASRRWQIDAK